MTTSVPGIVGRNVKARREALGMTAKTLGEHLGRYFPRKDGTEKPWPTSAVFQMESGGRSMTPEEVAALAQILDCAIADLFTADGSQDVSIGALTAGAADWKVLPSAASVDDQVSLRLFHAAEQVEQSMRASKALYEALVRDVAAQAKVSPALRERIEQERDLARQQVRRDLEDVIGGDFSEEEIDANPTPRMTAARDILEG